MGVGVLFKVFLHFGPPLLAQAPEQKARWLKLEAESLGLAHLSPSSLAGKK